MEDLLCINFTYRSPNEDIENAMIFDKDGVSDVKQTLFKLHALLTENINKINYLLENADHIVDIIAVGYGMVGICLKSETVERDLLNNQTLIKHDNTLENEDLHPNDFDLIDEEETNQKRLEIVNNLVAQDDSHQLFCRSEASDSDSDIDDVIDIEKDSKYILEKYIGLINKDISNSEHEDRSESE